MKLKKLFLITMFLLLFANICFAQEQKVDVDITIVSHEIKDAYVVGDSFWYKVEFTNIGIGIINDNFNISVFNPSGNLIDSRNYDILLEPNESKTINSTGGKKGEVAAFPFDTNGDYKMEIKSKKLIDFYRWFDVKTGKSTYRSYNRQPMTFKYYFDVMPRWQYDLWKDTKEINKEMLDATEEMNDATKKSLKLTEELDKVTKEVNDATKNIEYATYAMLVVAFVTLFVSLSKR
ncbi:hypothetical protein BEH94_02900 [Candidatus Altiarchaeales archaeon WOR_SM1_SCG]|nr:hypothetical protein BEH94_02900 [Candidatus Altiarchaeales archaeon WOR_SM1_SCG]